MRISDWSSDVCSSDLTRQRTRAPDDARDCDQRAVSLDRPDRHAERTPASAYPPSPGVAGLHRRNAGRWSCADPLRAGAARGGRWARSEEHTSELQSLMRISYAVFCLKQNTSLSDTK